MNPVSGAALTSVRAERLVELLPEAGIDALLVSALPNVRYVTGYSGSNGLAVLGPHTRAFITDFRYVTQAAEEVEASFERRRASQDLLDAVEEVLPDGGLRLGFEEAHVSVRQHVRMRELLPERVELVGVSDLVERLRAVKDSEEIARIKAATELADESFLSLCAQPLIGRTEREVALALEDEIRKRGAERPSFDTIVATGAHGALPHAKPRGVEIQHGDAVVIDWGAELDGYCSDCTRTVIAGELASEVKEVYELVLAAQLAGLDALRAGADAREVDGVARAVIESGGYGEQFGHGLGHGVGIEVHEGPRLARQSDARLRAGNVVTVEPGVYLPDRFGIRIEDLAVVTDDGSEILTSVTKDPIIVG